MTVLAGVVLAKLVKMFLLGAGHSHEVVALLFVFVDFIVERIGRTLGVGKRASQGRARNHHTGLELSVGSGGLCRATGRGTSETFGVLVRFHGHSFSRACWRSGSKSARQGENNDDEQQHATDPAAPHHATVVVAYPAAAEQQHEKYYEEQAHGLFSPMAETEMGENAATGIPTGSSGCGISGSGEAAMA